MLLGDRVDRLRGFVDLRLGHDDLAVFCEEGQSGGRLSRSDIRQFGDLVTGHGLARHDREDGFPARSRFKVSLRGLTLAGRIVLVQGRDQFLSFQGHFVIEVSGGNSFIEGTKSHGLLLSALSCDDVGHHPIYLEEISLSTLHIYYIVILKVFQDLKLLEFLSVRKADAGGAQLSFPLSTLHIYYSVIL